MTDIADKVTSLREQDMWEEISPLQDSAAWVDPDTFTVLQYAQLSSCIPALYSAFNLGGPIQDRKLKVTKTLHSQVYYRAQIIRL